MDKKQMEEHLASYKGSEGSFPFGPEAMVFKVMGKMFSLVSQDTSNPSVTFKCVPQDGAMLVSQFESVTPGYHMNKKHWITISLTDELSDDMFMSLAEDSYNLITSKLTKKDKAVLQTL